MHNIAHGRIKNVIEETNSAFAYCRGSLNVDYAEFATLSLTDFKTALRNPNLTREQLVMLLRDGAADFRQKDPEGCWATFLAQYMQRSANTRAI